MLDTHTLNQLMLDAFSGKMTWLVASKLYPLSEYIEAFFRTREIMQKTVADLTDAQVAFVIEGTPTWTISEMVTHLIYSQNFYYNQLIANATSSGLSHMVEAARGFGEGAQTGRPAQELQAQLAEATKIITEAIARTHTTFDPNRIIDTGPKFFGLADYPTWILLMLGHEVDHVRQGIIMRRAARHAIHK